MMLIPPSRVAALVACLILINGSALADPPYIFNFENGPGGDFEIVNDGDLWSIDTDGPNLRISKPDDPLVVEPHGYIFGGIQSAFLVEVPSRLPWKMSGALRT